MAEDALLNVYIYLASINFYFKKRSWNRNIYIYYKLLNQKKQLNGNTLNSVKN